MAMARNLRAIVSGFVALAGWILAAFLFPLCVESASASGPRDEPLFRGDRINPFQLQIEPEAVKQLKKQPLEFVPAKVFLENEIFSGAQVRLIGHGSFQPVTDKPNLCLKLGKPSVGKRPSRHKRLLLKNSAQDGSLLRRKLASELFALAGLPAARVNFARVVLNGRDLGFYVIEEPVDKVFLADHFHSASGNLYEGSNTDITDRLEVDSGDASGAPAALMKLAAVCQDTNLNRRWQQLCLSLEITNFIAFMAMEVLICHHDGYSMDDNNFRIYHDPATDRMTFIPHGMDLVFDRPELPLEPDWRGLVAKAVMETQEGRQMYRRCVSQLGRKILGTNSWEVRLRAWSQLLRENFADGEDAKRRTQWDAALIDLEQLVRRRTEFVLTTLRQFPAE